MDPFRDRVAVITGGASGIGRAMAHAFAARGASLALADIDEEALADAERELSAAGARVLAVPTDVRDRERVESLAVKTLRHFGRVHIVCNNAGILTLGPVADAPPSDWEITMAINFWGVVHGVQAFLPRLIEQNDGGHIVNTASMAGLVGMRSFGIYCASKFAVVGLTESLERDCRPHDIGVSVLCPMIVATGIDEHSRRLLGKPPLEPAAGGEAAQDALAGGVIRVEEVASRVVRGIENRDFYILTHPEQREILRRRAARLDASFEGEFSAGIG